MSNDKHYFYHYVNDAYLDKSTFENKYIVKIGYTKDPQSRLRQFLTGSPIKGRFDILYQVNFENNAEALDFEQNLHKLMDDFRFNKVYTNFSDGGIEWFVFDDKEHCKNYFETLMYSNYVDFKETFYQELPENVFSPFQNGNNILMNSKINISPIVLTQPDIIDRDSIQRDIILKMSSYYQYNSRGILNLPTGYGKTNISLKFCVKQNYNKILVLVPKLKLLSQFYESIRRYYQFIKIYIISSDTTSVEQTRYTKHYQSKDIADIKFVEDKHIVICVYNSCERLKDKEFDMIIFDEAHHMVTSISNETKFYQFGLNDENIKSQHRLFLTATCKFIEIRKTSEISTDDNSSESSESSETIVKCSYSMDNKEIFGDIIEQVSLRKAIEQNICCDYQVLLYNEYVLKNTNELLSPDVEYTPISRKKKLNQEKMTIKYQFAIKNLYEAMYKFNKNKVVLYFSYIKHCKIFIEMFKNSLINKDEIWIDIISSNDNRDMSQRELLLTDFKTNSKKCILCNVDIMTEGIDIPNIDMIGFIDKCDSTIKIIQCMGRMLRKYEDKIGHVFIPDVIYKDNVGKGEYKRLRVLVRSLAEIDFKLFSYKVIRDMKPRISSNIKKPNEEPESNTFEDFLDDEEFIYKNELHKKNSNTFSFYPYIECCEIVRKENWTAISEWKVKKLWQLDDRIPKNPIKIYESDGCLDLHMFLDIEKDIKKQYKIQLTNMFKEFNKHNNNPTYIELEECISQNPILYDYYILQNELNIQNISYYQLTGTLSKYPSRNELEKIVRKLVIKNRMDYTHLKDLHEKLLEQSYYDEVLKLYPNYPKIFHMAYL